MIEFDVNKYHRTRDNGVYLSYSQIEELTEMILLDYDSQIVKEPQAVDYDDFLECYLNVGLVDYQHIYTTSKQGEILGCSIFSKQSLPVFNKEKMCKDYIVYSPKTVVLDKSLVDGDRKIQENITGLHEAGHIWLHSYFFLESPDQLTLKSISDQRICCRKSGMEPIERVNPSTGELWREWQATTFAVTFALPKKSLDISVRELFRQYGIGDGPLITDADNGAWELAVHTIPGELSKIYDMSKEAIRYRLEKTGFYITKKKYEEEHAQMSLFNFI